MSASSDYPFDRPLIIVGAPRSGSTLLFETLAASRSVWSIGDESHGVFERVRALNPGAGGCASNRLLAADAKRPIVTHLRQEFMQQLQDAGGRKYAESGSRCAPRLLEKTPKNSLRIPFLNEVFPDALYVFLYRDPRENLSSMIEAWRSSDFVTYAELSGWKGRWSLLLPPDYARMQGRPLEEIVAFQWCAANEFIMHDLGEMPAERWTALSYRELVDDPAQTVRRLCEFADIDYDDDLSSRCEASLPLSRYTKTDPRPDKWRRNGAMIERVIPGLKPLTDKLAAFVRSRTASPVLLTTASSTDEGMDAVRPLGRNEPCHCGSKRRYKHCHGQL